MSVPTIDYISDWAARLRSRLYTQFRGRVTWEQWVQLLARQFQDLEDSAQTLVTLLDIDNSVGVQLDVIGKIVGQSRREKTELTDEEYRLRLKARIVANASSGSSEDLYRVLRTLLGASIGLIVTTVGLTPKAFVMRVKGAITHVQALASARMLADAKEAGAHGILKWQEAEDSKLFRFNSGPGFNAGVFADAAEIKKN